MRVYEGSDALADRARGCVLTVGNFDGLHVGHRSLVDAVVERSQSLGKPAALYTFDPHPRSVLYPDRAPPRLRVWEQLAQELERLGIDLLIREAFTSEFSTLSPEAFLRSVVVGRVGPDELLVGRDFHFGKGRSGSGETLSTLLPTLGVRVDIIPQVEVDGEDVSSTRIRESLRAGDVAASARLLGQPYTVWGQVIEGDRRGRTLGFPTLNLAPEHALIPAKGVYATTVRLFEGDALERDPRRAVTNVGTRPTFDRHELLAETHLLDFEGDLYGRRIALSFHERVRDEQRFSGPDALKQQIGRDVARARELLREGT